MPSAVQLNVRMDASLKAAGDAAASQCGWTPTQLVRALWEYLAVHDCPPVALQPALNQARFNETCERADAPTRELVGHELVDSFYERFGYPKPAVEQLDYDALRAAAAREQYGDWGLERAPLPPARS